MRSKYICIECGMPVKVKDIAFKYNCRDHKTKEVMQMPRGGKKKPKGTKKGGKKDY